jgi:two-component sensor histidine kinase
MTLAQVYDHLLGIGLSRTIDFGAYLSSLCSTIESLQTERHADVALIHDFKSVTLDLDCATALGLVISELISNSYDHAFPDGKGVIRLSLSCPAPGGEGIIVLADDGVGFVDAPESKRHGLGLVRRLMQQVDGTATLRSSRGSEWTLRFPLPATSPAAGKLG